MFGPVNINPRDHLILPRRLLPRRLFASSVMSSLATFCDVPVSAAFDAHAATCRVSLEWVISSGLSTHNSQISGLLTLPCDVGVMSMALNNVPVIVSLASDLVLGMDWLHFVRSSAPDLVVRLGSGASLDVRRHPISVMGSTESELLSSSAGGS